MLLRGWAISPVGVIGRGSISPVLRWKHWLSGTQSFLSLFSCQKKQSFRSFNENREFSPAVLVTGGAGYIGSHACKALANAGYLPVTYDSLIYGHDWAVKWGPLELGDILNRARLDEVIAAYKPTAIMHFAAFAYVGESVADPGKYYRNNVAGSLTLLEAARDHGIEHFVFSSTCATYGIPSQLPITEDTPQNPINPYGASKLMVERMLADFDAAHGLRSISLRYFNAAGADPDNQIGEDHNPETHLIPLVLDAASGPAKPSLFLARITTRRMAPASATIFMSVISPMRM